MINKPLIIFALILLSCTSYSQQEPVRQNFPDSRWRVGFVFTDLISNRFTLNVDHRLSGPHVLGASLGILYGTEDMNNLIYISQRQPLSGVYTNASYKFYFAASRSQRTYFFTRFAGFYQSADVTYYGLDYIKYEEDGLTYYSYGEVDKTYNANSVGGQVETGFEFYYNPFFMELSFGMQYRQKVNSDLLPQEFRSGDKPLDIDYTGPCPILGYKIGIYLD